MMASMHDFARAALDREERKGVPEVILADRKSIDQSIAIVNIENGIGAALMGALIANRMAAARAAPGQDAAEA